MILKKLNEDFLSRGFTLVELLIVIGVIGVLVGALVAIINPEKHFQRARDTKRISILQNIQGALQSYLIFNGNFPLPNSGGVSTCSTNCGGWEVAGCGVPFIKSLIDSQDLKSDIKDPTMNGNPSACYNIRYYRYPAGNAGCDASKGDFFVLGIANMESASGTHPDSPGWSCPGRNWQTEFEWVTGGFQR